jgi:hypothetical protein
MSTTRLSRPQHCQSTEVIYKVTKKCIFDDKLKFLTVNKVFGVRHAKESHISHRVEIKAAQNVAIPVSQVI